jgi:hypothetical protein
VDIARVRLREAASFDKLAAAQTEEQARLARRGGRISAVSIATDL